MEGNGVRFTQYSESAFNGFPDSPKMREAWYALLVSIIYPDPICVSQAFELIKHGRLEEDNRRQVFNNRSTPGTRDELYLARKKEIQRRYYQKRTLSEEKKAELREYQRQYRALKKQAREENNHAAEVGGVV